MISLGRRDAWWRADQPRSGKRSRTLRRMVFVAALLALVATVAVGIAGTIGGGSPAAVSLDAAPAWRGAGEGGRPIPTAFASGALLVTLLMTTALTIGLTRHPRGRTR